MRTKTCLAWKNALVRGQFPAHVGVGSKTAMKNSVPSHFSGVDSKTYVKNFKKTTVRTVRSVRTIRNTSADFSNEGLGKCVTKLAIL
jgi:predicted sugar kinase